MSIEARDNQYPSELPPDRDNFETISADTEMSDEELRKKFNPDHKASLFEKLDTRAKKFTAALAVGALALGGAFGISKIAEGSSHQGDTVEPVATGPAVPGQLETTSPQVTSEPSPLLSPSSIPSAETSTANEVGTPLPIEEWKFNNTDGNSRSQADVISESKVSPDVHETLKDQYNTIFSRIESAINYFPDEQTVRANLNIPVGEELTREHYFIVVKEYQNTVFNTVIKGGGELRAKFDRLGRDTAFYHGQTIGAGDKELYEIKIVPDVVGKQKVTILDNGGLNYIGANIAPDIGEFRYYSPTMDDLTVPQVPLNVDPAEYEPTWQISGSVQLIAIK